MLQAWQFFSSTKLALLVTTHSSPDKEQREARLPLESHLKSLARLTKLVTQIKNPAVYVSLHNCIIYKSSYTTAWKEEDNNFVAGEGKSADLSDRP